MIREKSRGQSLVEFGLTLPLLLLLVFTFVDMGRAVYYYSALSNAVREGARYASVTPQAVSAHSADVKAVVQSYSVALVILSDNITFPIPVVDDPDTGDTTVPNPADYVTVQASYDFAPVTPFLARILGGGNTITLNAEATMMLTPYGRQ